MRHMLMTRGRLAAASLLTLAVLGCGSNAQKQGADRVEAAPAAAALAPSQRVLRLHLPFDDYLLSVDEIYFAEGARDRLTEGCMRMRGFDWRPVARPQFGDWRNRRRYGVIELAVAKRYGYHPVRGLLAPVQVYNEKVRRESALSDAAWVAAEDPAHGCESQANGRLWSDIPYDTSRISRLNGSMFNQAKHAASVRRATRAWADCMRSSGFQYASPDQAAQDSAWRARTASRREVAVAVADVRCKGRSRFVDALSSAETALQRKAIARDGPYFRQVLRDKDRYLLRARRILTSTRSASIRCPDTHDPGNVPRPARTPLAHAHAHNDYAHPHPLFDALAHRFSSVEADVWLTADGKLLVGHDKSTLDYPDCTLQALYLDPLQDLARTHGGHVYSDSAAPLQLLVDVKGDGPGTYKALDRLLRDRYASMLTSWTNGREHPGAVRVIVSGAIDRASMSNQTQRYAAYDGTLNEIGSRPHTGGDASGVAAAALISAKWTTLTPDQRGHLRDIVSQAHAHGQQVRFWDTPEPGDREYRDVWREELNNGVDWLNTDQLGALQDFLK
jgi:glycerophosphoryl diester phosphodiesterase